MSRRAFCQACHNRDHGVKTRVSVPHTCGDITLINTTARVVKKIGEIEVARQRQKEMERRLSRESYRQ